MNWYHLIFTIHYFKYLMKRLMTFVINLKVYVWSMICLVIWHSLVLYGKCFPATTIPSKGQSKELYNALKKVFVTCCLYFDFNVFFEFVTGSILVWFMYFFKSFTGGSQARSVDADHTCKFRFLLNQIPVIWSQT